MYFNEIKKGMKIPLSPVTIDQDEMLGFAKNYDDVPIHTDEKYAQSTHFGRLLAPGMFTFLKLWNEYLKRDPIGDGLLAGRSTKVEWSEPVFAGDVLTAQAEITELIERNPKNGIVVMEIRAENQSGSHVLTATVESIVRTCSHSL